MTSFYFVGLIRVIQRFVGSKNIFTQYVITENQTISIILYYTISLKMYQLFVEDTMDALLMHLFDTTIA